MSAQIEAGAQALTKAFPTLCDDFTEEWFRKAAQIVLEAAGEDAAPRWDYQAHYDAAFDALGDEQYGAATVHALLGIMRLLWTAGV